MTENTTAASGAASLGPLSDRAVKDAIRSAYDLGYNDARNARTVPGDSAPGYKGRDVERDHGGALIHALSRALAAPAAQPCQTCADRADGFYGSYAPDCPTHTAAPAAQEAEPAAVVAHCLLRRNSYGKWVHDAKHWADGPAPAELVRDVEKYPDHYRIRNAYAEPAPRPQADAGAVAVPEGWRLVPVEPTPGMLSVGAYNVQCDYDSTIETIARHAYRVMVEAAPQAPAAPTLNVSEER